jgi:large subunit ribosomal protein L18
MRESQAERCYAFRKARSRKRIARLQGVRPRLVVHRTSKHIYAQVIDDNKQQTLAAASSLTPELSLKAGGNKTAAEAVGALIAQRAISKGVKQVVFDRSGYKYHGRVSTLAESARKAGLDF